MTEYAIFRFFIYPKLISFGMDSTFATKMIESMNVAMVKYVCSWFNDQLLAFRK